MFKSFERFFVVEVGGEWYGLLMFRFICFFYILVLWVLIGGCVDISMLEF